MNLAKTVGLIAGRRQFEIDLEPEEVRLEEQLECGQQASQQGAPADAYRLAPLAYRRG